MHVHLLISFTVTWTDLLLLAGAIIVGTIFASPALWPGRSPAPIERVFEYRNVRRITGPTDVRDYAVEQGYRFFDWQQHDQEVW